ncbi:hypothetical protein HH1059_09150 [Halorhodospira halochloris]|uniref:Uncharacterized protein n=1 Tax=Halorhodospira halochloris TaxID=1052 RepID=A0A2Z6EZL6_HALHR|nr:hypothetical protein HH1059_09150 [Halorhodospira halochloris]
MRRLINIVVFTASHVGEGLNTYRQLFLSSTRQIALRLGRKVDFALYKKEPPKRPPHKFKGQAALRPDVSPLVYKAQGLVGPPPFTIDTNSALLGGRPFRVCW